jgi:L-fuculose-phosphate aldolase
MCSRDEVIGTARRMLALGLVTGTFGNVSCRLDGGILITPSGMPYGRMRPSDLVRLDASGAVVEGLRAPSSEYRLHVAIYARLAKVRAIVHTHSPCAVRFASRSGELRCRERDGLRGPVPVAPFRPAGTQDLADRAAEILMARGAEAIILEDHGVVGVGADLESALAVCRAVESAAERALS